MLMAACQHAKPVCLDRLQPDAIDLRWPTEFVFRLFMLKTDMNIIDVREKDFFNTELKLPPVSKYNWCFDRKKKLKIFV